MSTPRFFRARATDDIVSDGLSEDQASTQESSRFSADSTQEDPRDTTRISTDPRTRTTNRDRPLDTGRHHHLDRSHTDRGHLDPRSSCASTAHRPKFQTPRFAASPRPPPTTTDYAALFRRPPTQRRLATQQPEPAVDSPSSSSTHPRRLRRMVDAIESSPISSPEKTTPWPADNSSFPSSPSPLLRSKPRHVTQGDEVEEASDRMRRASGAMDVDPIDLESVDPSNDVTMSGQVTFPLPGSSSAGDDIPEPLVKRRRLSVDLTTPRGGTTALEPTFHRPPRFQPSRPAQEASHDSPTPSALLALASPAVATSTEQGGPEHDPTTLLLQAADWSPPRTSRRPKQRYVPGGMAAQVQNWLAQIRDGMDVDVDVDMRMVDDDHQADKMDVSEGFSYRVLQLARVQRDRVGDQTVSLVHGVWDGAGGLLPSDTQVVGNMVHAMVLGDSMTGSSLTTADRTGGSVSIVIMPPCWTVDLHGQPWLVVCRWAFS